MKFLCVECDEGMKLVQSDRPSEDALSAVFECPGCGWRFALLTNPWETQLLKSLDVRVGGKSDAAAAEPMAALRSSLSAAGASPAPSGGSDAAAGATRPSCPFAGMVAQQQAHGAAAASPATPAAIPPASVPMRWTEEAMLRLERVPAFVRNMARSGIEEFARSQGLTEVTGEVMDAARQKFGM